MENSSNYYFQNYFLPQSLISILGSQLHMLDLLALFHQHLRGSSFFFFFFFSSHIFSWKILLINLMVNYEKYNYQGQRINVFIDLLGIKSSLMVVVPLPSVILIVYQVWPFARMAANNSSLGCTHKAIPPIMRCSLFSDPSNLGSPYDLHWPIK